MAEVKGGNRLKDALEARLKKLTKKRAVEIGFLSDAKYPDGKSVAMVAAIQDFGAPKRGIPPRPFFRNMIAAKKGEWPKAISDLLKANDLDAEKTLEQVGQAVEGQLQQSIIDTNAPPLKQSTIDRKGFAKPLIDTGHMKNSTGHRVID